MKKNRFVLFALLFFVLLPALGAQASTGDSSLPSTQFDMNDFPQWAKDLRRAEIVAFGTFPFAYFFSNFGYDLYRYKTNDWDIRYAPWPIKGAGAVEQTHDEKLKVLAYAAGGAVLIAIVDFGIERFKRSRRENVTLPEGTPIIIRKPLVEENAEESPGEDAAESAEPPETGSF
jgi:hypothetical protein